MREAQSSPRLLALGLTVSLALLTTTAKGNEPNTSITKRPKIGISRETSQLEKLLTIAHSALEKRELETASKNYRAVLQIDPNQTDALLHLAAICWHQGQRSEATHLRRRALIAAPDNMAAQAANLALSLAGTSASEIESRLKGLLVSAPDSGELHFTLGALFARQQRWAEAQHAFVNAVAVAGDNPDYLFNLAVSLDHLQQTASAAQHYRLALTAARQRPASFRSEHAEHRLQEIEP